MRAFVALLGLLLLAAPVHAEASEEADTELEPLDHGDEDHDSPGLGLLALVGAVGAVAYARRK